MESIRASIELRAAEIELFIRFVRRVQRPSRIRGLGFEPGSTEFVPMLKACLFVMLYNMVESGVRAGFSAVYDDMRKNEISFGQATPELQRIWLMQQLDSRTPLTSANRDTYLNAFISVATRISSSGALDLDSRELPVSGNLSATQIRELCKKHGVELKVPAWARGGAELETIKIKRNGLAHGHISFAECGRDYAIDDLERMFKQARHFVRGFIGSLARYAARRRYEVRPKRPTRPARSKQHAEAGSI